MSWRRYIDKPLELDEDGYVKDETLVSNKLNQERLNQDLDYDSDFSDDMEASRQLEENLETLKIVWQMLVIPTVSRWIGRRVALWAWEKVRFTYNFPSSKYAPL